MTVPLAGEITRLEMTERGYESLDRIGFSQTKIERFYSQYLRIPHPFDASTQLDLSQEALNRATRLVVYVVFQPVKEPRLSGYESKFVGAFSRYLTCPRDSSSSPVEQVAALFEPFLKKLSFLFNILDGGGKPIWGCGLEGLIPGLGISSSNLKETNTSYWQRQSAEDAILRVAYQLRHKGAHEAHDYAYYERERNAYYVFAAILVVCKRLMDAKTEIVETIAHQGNIEMLRDLFVKIDELVYGPDGPRDVSESPEIPSRLEKLLAVGRRAQAIWPTCSAGLADGLESEYFAVKHELTESDREADIESYLEDQRY